MLTNDDRRDLDAALELLERRSLLVTLSDALGRPLERLARPLPRQVRERIDAAAALALRRALDVALGTLARDPRRPAREWLERGLATASGGVGGALGLASLPVELPISTTLMLRSVADIARSEGADLDDPEVRLACLEVFALGAPGSHDDAAETGYWAARTALAQLTHEAARQVARHGAASRGSPALLRFVNAVAARFGVTVGERALLRAVPVVGALGGGALNYAFTEHLQRTARGHFVVRRLERAYGRDAVRAAAREVDSVHVETVVHGELEG